MHKLKSYIDRGTERIRLSLWQRSHMLTDDKKDIFPLAYAPQRHELEIVRYFEQRGGMGKREGKNNSLPTHKNIVMCFLNRSGSNLLAEALHATGQTGLADEFFNYDRVFERCGKMNISRLDDYTVSLAADDFHGTKNGVLATKMSWDQLCFLTKTGIIPGIIESPHFIMVKRRDLVAQAVSFLTAHKTGQWKSNWQSSYGHEQADFEITDDEIKDMIAQLAFAETQFRKYFALFDVKPITVYYEDLNRDIEGQVRMVLDRLGLDGRGAVIDSSQIKVKKQRHDKKQAILESFKQRHALG